MEKPTCKDCQHFRQHYVHFFEDRYNAIPCGHCVFPRIKARKPATLACVYFTPKDEETAGK